MLKIDGHTHTQFSPQSHDEDAELMIQRAIAMGFKEYALMERAPLPAEFADQFGGNTELRQLAAMSMDQVPQYLEYAQSLQRKYAHQLRIHVGFEVDYLPGLEGWTINFLNEVGPLTDNNILALHYLRGRDGKLWALDTTPEDFATGFGDMLQFPEHLFKSYYSTLLHAVHADLGVYTPRCVGQMGLVRQFQDYFGLPRTLTRDCEYLVIRVLHAMHARGASLEVGVAGLYQEFNNELYPLPWVIDRARRVGVPLVYGSDAHNVHEVGRGYHAVEALLE